MVYAENACGLRPLRHLTRKLIALAVFRPGVGRLPVLQAVIHEKAQ